MGLAILVTVGVISAAIAWMLRARRAEALVRQLSSELDAAALAGAALSADRDQRHIADACAAVAAHGARELERHLSTRSTP